MSEADVVMGTHVKSNEGWQERAKVLCDPNNISVTVDCDFDALTVEERRRLEPKLAIVERLAGYMVAGMIKGTVKYPTDDYTLSDWMKSLIGEGADFLNYIGLTEAAFRGGVK